MTPAEMIRMIMSDTSGPSPPVNAGYAWEHESMRESQRARSVCSAPSATVGTSYV